MPKTPCVAPLASREVIRVGGEGWRDFLQGLLTQDVLTLDETEIRFAALLTPQGRLLFDLFVVGADGGCLLDCAADQRDALLQRLAIYRLRAKVEIAPSDVPVLAVWGGENAAEPWREDPRLPALGHRGYGAEAPAGAQLVDEAAYDRHRLALGVPATADWGSDSAYPIEADFDLLNGIDFHKGCFVGQETTSRMKRRGNIKSRMIPIAFEGAPPSPGAELLAGPLRAGEVRSGLDGAAIALVRLDRLAGTPRTLPDGRTWEPRVPEWLG